MASPPEGEGGNSGSSGAPANPAARKLAMTRSTITGDEELPVARGAALMKGRGAATSSGGWGGVKISSGDESGVSAMASSFHGGSRVRHDGSESNGSLIDHSGRRISMGSSEKSRSQVWRDLMQPFQATPADFELDGKEASRECLERWRRASLVLNSRRRFRYTADLDSRSQSLTVGALGMALAAAGRFKLGVEESESVKRAQEGGFGLGANELKSLVEGQNVQNLGAYGGIKGVSLALGVPDLAGGIQGCAEDIERRVSAYGTNTYPEKAPKGFLSFLWDACQDFTLLILAFCAVISVPVGLATEGFPDGLTDGAGILLSVLLVVFVTATSDYRQSLQFLELEREKKKISIPVMRAGQRQKLSVYDIVVGDVVLLSIGDIIPTDGILITGQSLVVDESSMTGESDPVHKSVGESPFLLAGTKVQDGSGTYLTTGVGMNTEWGHLLAKLSESGEEETPLQVKLSGVATLVGRLGLYVALLVFVILIVRIFPVPPGTNTWFVVEKVVDAFAVAVTIVVVAVPEGLPLAVTLSLAYAMQKMMVDKALVRKLAACETMGSATIICSDKTGTLTANKMAVVRIWLYSAVRDVGGTEPVQLGVPQGTNALLLESLFFNTSGDVQTDPVTHQLAQIQGSPTEAALLTLGARLGGNFEEVRSGAEILHVDPFNSKRKRMGVALRIASTSSSPSVFPRSSSLSAYAAGLISPRRITVRVFWKGAAEIVAGMCSHVLSPSGQVIPLKGEEVEGVLKEFTSDALRTLAIAYTDLDPAAIPPGVAEGGAWPEDAPLPTSGLRLLAIVGIQDPLRPQVPAAVATCKNAGIKVLMVTGDNLTTAMAIARGCGILTEGGKAVEGPEFRNMSPAEMQALIPHLQVMARSSPSDKHTLVQELRAMGEVVAVTGDGTNDAPALKLADIGLAMGIAGTEVAKEAADVVILDDNFASVVNVAKWGRSVYTNIQKFVQFQLTVNIVALATNFIAAVFTGEAPLTAVELLWVNLIMDTLGALALATEPPTDELMDHHPVGRHAPFISNIMWRNMMGQAVFQLAALITLHFAGPAWFSLNPSSPSDSTILNTIIFNTFVFCQVFNEINAREMEKINVFRNIFRSPLFLGIISFTVLMQVVMVQYGGRVVGTAALNLRQFLFCVAVGFVSMPVAAAVKLLPVPKAPFLAPLMDRFFPHSSNPAVQALLSASERHAANEP